MIRARIVAAAMMVATAWNLAPLGMAADPPDLFLEHLDDFIWNGSADGTTWQNAGNWTAPAAHPGEFPDDPNRIDDPAVAANVTTINSLEGANLSVALPSDLTVNINGSKVTVASLKLGGTGAAVTTNVVSTTGHQLAFENTELNDTVTDPANTMWSFNQGNSLIWSTGTAGAGKENRITAGTLLNDVVDVEGDRDLHIYGDITEGVIDRDAGDAFTETLPSSLNNLMSSAGTLYIHGVIHTLGLSAAGEMTAGDADRLFGLNTNRGFVLPPVPPPDPLPPAVPRNGKIDITGSFAGDGSVHLGSADGGNVIPNSVIVLRGDSSAFTGRLILNRVNLVLDNDNALGGGDLKTGNPSQGLGFNFISTADNRKIGTTIIIAQYMTVKGAASVPGLEAIGDHSLEFSGQISQSNTRGLVNLLPAGKTLTLSGKIYPNQEAENPPNPGRYLTIDGTGRTLITGGIHNMLDDPDTSLSFTGSFRKRGTGTVVIDYNESNVSDTASDYGGYTLVEGGNLHFAAANDLPNLIALGDPTPYPAEILSAGGAVGFDAGTFGPDGGTFLAMFNNSSNPNAPGQLPPSFSGGFFRTTTSIAPVFETYDSGGLMLGASEYGSVGSPRTLDFTMGSLANAANMTLAAWETGSTFIGTITPSSTVPVNKDTYQLGGGAGTLTLPNANQLTGARKLLVTNGGEVKIANTQNYTDKTRVVGKFLPTNQAGAAADQSSVVGANNNLDVIGGDTYRASTLTVTSLTDAGTASGIGSFASSSDATGLLIQGSTLKYVEGGTTSTNRLFTVGTVGATVDASGAGPLTLSNTGALGVAVATNRTGLVSSSVAGNSNNEVFGVPLFSSGGQPVLFITEDLVPGMRVRDTVSAGATTAVLENDLQITDISSPHVITVGEVTLDEGETAWTGVGSATPVHTFEFGPAPARFLTLAGTNTGNNTLMPLVADASDRDKEFAPRASVPEVTTGPLGGPGGNGSVGIRKTGAGKWILTNNNTYTGQTNVEQGTLLINGAQTGGGAYTVSAGATLGGTGSITGALTNNGTVAPGASVNTLTVTGNVVMGAGSIYAVELLGATADKLAITGNLDLTALGNTLSVTDLGKTGTSWVIATYSGSLVATSVFETITPGYTVSYGTGSNSQVTLNFVGGGGVLGDYNSNGVVDVADYVVWRRNPGSLQNEGASPGIVDQADYNFWRAHFGATSGGGSVGGAGNVPEPACGWLAAMALAGSGYMRSRRSI